MFVTRIPTRANRFNNKAPWKAVHEIFGKELKMKDCHLHFCQSIHRNMKNYGLSKSYRNKNGKVRKLVTMLYALALIPANSVKEVFNYICNRAERDIEEQDSRMCSLLDYFKRFWLSGNNQGWGPKDWCVYCLEIRTNNVFKNGTKN